MVLFFYTKEEKILEKKEISFKSATRGIITGFISYGILIGFIFFVFIYNIRAYFNIVINNIPTAICISLIYSAVLFYILHFLCRLSTYDVFKKYKIKPENNVNIFEKMKIFFIFLFFLVSAFIFFNLLTTLYDTQIEIYKTYAMQSQVFSQNFNTTLTSKMINEYNDMRLLLIIKVIILEIGLIIDFLSIIPFQKKMINKYNK